MKFIPREELAFIVDHLDIDDVGYFHMKQLFDMFGDDWFVEGCTWMKTKENEERKKELERLGYKGVKEIQD